MHLALCSRRLPAGRHAHAEKCADASGELFTRNVWHYFYEPLVLCRVFSSRHIALGGALDGEELVLRRRGLWEWRGRRESDSQVTRHKQVSVTHCIGDVM